MLNKCRKRIYLFPEILKALLSHAFPLVYTQLHLISELEGFFIHRSLELVLRVVNINQVGPRSKMGCSFRFRCQNCISTQSELKRAIFDFDGEKWILSCKRAFEA